MKEKLRVTCPKCDTSFPLINLALGSIRQATLVCSCCKHQFDLEIIVSPGQKAFGFQVTKDKVNVKSSSRSSQPKPGEDTL